jgi:hypothetical protein
MTFKRSRYLYFVEQGFVLSGAFHAVVLSMLSYPNFLFYYFAAAFVLVLVFISIRLVEDVPLEKRTTSINFPLEVISLGGIALTIPVWIGFIVTILWMVTHEPVVMALVIEAGSIPLLVGLSLIGERIYRRRHTLSDS